MYKHTKSTNKTSVYRKKDNPKIYLEKIYESSKTIFVGRNIVSEALFGGIPQAHPEALISSNKKYLQNLGYLENQISGLPDWFLFYPKISLLIKFLRVAAYKNPEAIPFELNFIAFNETQENGNPQAAVKSKNNEKASSIKTALEIAFENAKK